MESMDSNGKIAHGPPFAMIGQGFVVLPASKVVEMIEVNVRAQAKENLLLSALFRKTADAFREWSKQAECGQVFSVPEVNLQIIRLSIYAPMSVVVSEAAEKSAQAKREAGEDSFHVKQDEPKAPRIALA